MDYKIVIPSYNRVRGLIDKTLKTLSYHGVESKKIVLFVANEEERMVYEESCSRLVGEIVVGVKGLGPQRNFIMSYFPEGTPLVSLDDDVECFYKMVDKKLCKLFPLEFEEMVQKGFAEMKTSGASLFGIYPCQNAFFMSEKVSYDLKFVIGSFWGCFSSSGIVIEGNGEKEDYQRCIQYWERDKKIVRLNNFCFKTATYKNSGGMQSDGVVVRVQREKAIVEMILLKYPQYVLLNKRRKSIFPEFLLRKQKKV
jgi:hypothetical protein